MSSRSSTVDHDDDVVVVVYTLPKYVVSFSHSGGRCTKMVVYCCTFVLRNALAMSNRFWRATRSSAMMSEAKWTP
eukprot:2735599-Amphidinium_carterae.1